MTCCIVEALKLQYSCCVRGKAMDYGYHVSLGQIMMVGISAEQCSFRVEQDSLALLTSKTKDLNQREDRQAFLQQFHQTFSLPKKFEFQPHKDDSVCCCYILYTRGTCVNSIF